jgi:uncharacterized repeat protein (TIGR01451 family)
VQITETVQGGPVDWTTSFSVQIDCGDAGWFPETIEYPDPGNVTHSNIDAGAVCEIWDDSMEGPPAGYEWNDDQSSITGSPATIVPGATIRVSIVHQLRLLPPAMSVEKEVATTVADDTWTEYLYAVSGSTVTYQIVVSNNGGAELHNVTLADDHRVDLTGTDCASVPDLKLGDTFTCRYTDVVTDGVTTNTATAVSKETTAEPASATVHGVAKLPLTKTNNAKLDALGLPSAHEGDTVGYTLEYTNPGDPAIDEWWISDHLPPGLTYVPGSASSTQDMDFYVQTTGDRDEKETFLGWYTDSLAASGAVSYRVTVDPGAAGYVQPLSNSADLSRLDAWISAQSDVYVSAVVADATNRPAAPTAPATDTNDAALGIVPGSGTQMILVLLAGITLAAALTVPGPTTRRRRRDS